MDQKSMTALVSAFSRAYHAQKNETKIFDDCIAGKLLTQDEYRQISHNMASGIGFFNPSFAGSPEEALRWIVDHQLSPTPLGRAAFAEKALETAVSIGARQYLILGAGYDTFAFRQPDWAKGVEIFEIDHPATAQDKKKRLEAAGIEIPQNFHTIAADFTQQQWQTALHRHPAFQREQVSFCSLLGLVYYLSKETFLSMLRACSEILPEGSSIVFDYPDQSSFSDEAGERAKKQVMLAEAADEKMLAGYSVQELEQLLSTHGFLIYEHRTPREMTQQYFSAYNQANPEHPIEAFDNVNYCLAVRK